MVKNHLDELNRLLARRVFRPDEDSPPPSRSEKEARAEKTAQRHAERRLGPNRSLLEKKLLARLTKDGSWPPGSLGHALREERECAEGISLSEYIDQNPDLSQLKYVMQEGTLSKLYAYDYNTRAVLEGYPAIADYLLAYAYGIMDVEDIHGLRSFVVNNRLGAKNVATYAAVGAARTIIEREKIKAGDPDLENNPIIAAIRSRSLPLSTADFKSSLKQLIHDQLFNSSESELIDKSKVGAVPASLKPLLIQYIKSSPVPIDDKNIDQFLPNFILKAHGTTQASVVAEETGEADLDFKVDIFADDQAMIQVSVSAVKCAAQLFHSMVLGDELEVFEAMNYFTHKYLLREALEIRDPRLREDLQLYVFSNKFLNLETNKVAERTRPAERKMFHRQVFNTGGGQVTEDLIVNHEFPRLWKMLVLESANYLERARESYNPDGYVSRQNVMQAVEDLQYNLSTHCTGMAQVLTPLIYAELNFIIRRIFMHPDVLRHVVPSGGTWWRVVENLYMGLRHQRPRATVLYNKAKLGYEILRNVATYNPATFQDDRVFSAFISDVDAFITTQSILQESLADDIKRGSDEEVDEYAPGSSARNGQGLPVEPMPRGEMPSTDGGSEWDF